MKLLSLIFFTCVVMYGFAQNVDTLYFEDFESGEEGQLSSNNYKVTNTSVTDFGFTGNYYLFEVFRDIGPFGISNYYEDISWRKEDGMAGYDSIVAEFTLGISKSAFSSYFDYGTGLHLNVQEPATFRDGFTDMGQGIVDFAFWFYRMADIQPLEETDDAYLFRIRDTATTLYNGTIFSVLGVNPTYTILASETFSGTDCFGGTEEVIPCLCEAYHFSQSDIESCSQNAIYDVPTFPDWEIAIDDVLFLGYGDGVVTSLQEEGVWEEKKIVRAYDILGKPVDPTVQGQLIFLQYEDGTIERTIQ